MVTGSVILLFLIFVTLIGPLVVSQSPYEMVVEDRLLGPGADHLLGTDEFGRDLLSRIVHGAKVTMGVGLLVAAIASFSGMVIGLYARSEERRVGKEC